MIIVIDGYNVLKQVFHEKQISERDRDFFIKQLKKYTKKKGHKIILVFDGGPYDWVSKERDNGVYIVYAGVNSTADDVIKRYLEEHQNLDILLISSDRDINRFAQRLDIEYIDSIDFYAILQKSVKKTVMPKSITQAKAVKISKEENEALDRLMQEASVVVNYKAEDFVNVHELSKSKSEARSKKEKKKLKQLKKL